MKKYDLYLTGTVGWSISAGYVKYVLDNSKGKPVNVAISSLGGFVDTGLQIYELFKNHGEVNVEFLGMSASAATFMAMGAKSIKMAKNALILIHNSMTWVGEYGSRNKEQIDECIKRLKFQRDQLSSISSDGHFSIDVSMKNMFAFVQGKGAKIKTLSKDNVTDTVVLTNTLRKSHRPW